MDKNKVRRTADVLLVTMYTLEGMRQKGLIEVSPEDSFSRRLSDKGIREAQDLLESGFKPTQREIAMSMNFLLSGGYQEAERKILERELLGDEEKK